MKFPLKEFEQHIDETILKRGLSYFRKGFVSPPEEISKNICQATVSGSEEYTVELTIKNGVVTEQVCNCLYDMGPVCKHIVAVLFCLQQEELGLAVPEPASRKAKTKPAAKAKTVEEQVNALLEKITHEELKEFIRGEALRQSSFRNSFLASFAEKNASESKALYAKQVKSALRTAAGRDGFIYWDRAYMVYQAVNELMMKAQQQLEKGNYRPAFFISTAVMEEMTDALLYSDDSNGEIGIGVQTAFETLSRMAGQKLPEDIRLLLLGYLLEAFKEDRYAGWDWHLGILQMAAGMLAGEDEAAQITALLDNIKPWDFEKERIQLIKYDVIKQTRGPAAANEYMEQNLSNTSFKRMVVAGAIKNKEFDKAKRILTEAIKEDKQQRPGLVKEWCDWLLKIAQAQDDRDQIIHYARMLFLDHFRGEQDYYQVMKNIVAPGEWTGFVERLVAEKTSASRWADTGFIADIYVREQWWERLLALLREHGSINYLEYYGNYLSKEYPGELVKLYAKAVMEYMENSTGRTHYQTTCRYLRRMIKLGGRGEVDGLVSRFKTLYPKRKALLEELEKV